MLYRLCCMILIVIIKGFRLLKISGKEKLPEGERYVVTCTHRGWLEIIMLAIALYPIPVHYMAKKELFEGKVKNWFFHSIKAFPVNRENPGPSTLKTPLKLLKDNKCIGMFPSGTRSNEELPLKRGAVTIALKGNAPLVPAVYKGPQSYKGLLKGEKAEIIFGEPILFSAEELGLKRDELIDHYLHELEGKMRELEEDVQ